MPISPSGKMGEYVWDLDAMPRIEGRTAIVTGAASGLGAQITRWLASKGASVVLVDIDVVKATVLAEGLRSLYPTVAFEVFGIDLGDLRTVRRFVDSFRSRHDSLDLLVNNAGIMVSSYARTQQGFESQWGINHLGHFSLTAQLLDLLVRNQGSRVVTQTSIVHRGGSIDFNDINSERSFRPWGAYKQSKLATLLFSRELQRRFELANIKSLISVACHPGLVDTALYSQRKKMRVGLRPFMHSIERGALPALRACLDPDVRGGEVYGPDGWMQFKGRPVQVQPLNKGKDMTLASKVWELSERMTGVDFTACLDEASVKMSVR